MGRRAGAPGRRAGSLLLAVLFALALSASPPAARTAIAASSPLRTQADASYTLDPDSGRVHVAIDVTETDLKPNTAQFIYYYTAFRYALQPGATSVKVSGGSAYRITTHKREGYVEATVQIGDALFYKQSTSFTIRYELVGGKPRSLNPTRVGAAYSTFGVWAWGDAGRGTVEVHTPAGFETRFTGSTMQVTSSATTGQILRATPDDPSKFYTIITADNAKAYTETRLSFAGGVEIVVQSWPEDGPWTDAVTRTLRDAVPELRELIGLDWPVAHDLDVRERYTPDLEGYAGFFLSDAQRIEVSEDLDPVVIVHEASHAWFNENLFSERWITEGLAEEYAWRTLAAVGAEPGRPPTKPDAKDPGVLSLEGWVFPQVIRDQVTDDHERYGYEAAFWVIDQIVDAVGVERMRDAFAGAADHLTAYPGRGTPEVVPGTNDWRRLLDLVSPLDAPDPTAIDAVLIEYDAYTGRPDAMVDRHVARDAYRALLDQGAGWLPPWYVRKPMGAWTFAVATNAIKAARTVLDLRDRVTAAAGPLGLTPNDALRTAYEGAQDTLAGATAIAEDELAALAAIASAKAKVEATPDLVTQIGLIGETPRAGYEAARTAFVAGKLDEAESSAIATAAQIDAAAIVGRDRILAVGGVALGLLLVLALAGMLLRRRLAGRRAAALATATLAADPAAAPAPSGAGPSGEDGGHEARDAPLDP